jgi:hypothetical protein
MKAKNLYIVMALLIISCSKKEELKPFPLESLIFSYAGLHHDNSIKFTKSDTVYLQKRFPEPKENFYAILNKSEKIELNKLMSLLNYKKYDSVYEQENLYDANSYLLNISENKKNKLIFIYGDKAPKELYNYIDSLGKFKSKLKFIKTKQIIDFGDLKYILPPPPPPPKKDSLEYK